MLSGNAWSKMVQKKRDFDQNYASIDVSILYIWNFSNCESMVAWLSCNSTILSTSASASVLD